MTLRLSLFASALLLAACGDSSSDDSSSSGDNGSGDDGNGDNGNGDNGAGNGDNGNGNGDGGAGDGKGDNGAGDGNGDGGAGDGGDPGGAGDGAGAWDGAMAGLLYDAVTEQYCYNYWWATSGTTSSNKCPDCEWSYDIDANDDLDTSKSCAGSATIESSTYTNGLILNFQGSGADIIVSTYDDWSTTYYLNGIVYDGASGTGSIAYQYITPYYKYTDNDGNPLYYGYYGYGTYTP